MRKLFITLSLLFAICGVTFSQNTLRSGVEDVEAYLLTCGPGSEVYSLWGHSALRVVDKSTGQDIVYNWGVFDFATKNFAWKFAKGRLNYMIAASTYKRFLQDYTSSNRWVKSQKINLNVEEMSNLLDLLDENMRPENVFYLYDFFYDNCATRIRDVIEKAVGNNFLYPIEDNNIKSTFRDEIGKYMKNALWLNFGTDLILGLPTDKKTTMKDRMFLPDGLCEGLSQSQIRRDGRIIPLLTNPTMVVKSDDSALSKKTIFSPMLVLSLLLIFVVLFSIYAKSPKANRIMDIILFSIFSLLALFMIFFNFFTDHIQCTRNLNIIWLNPCVIVCLIGLILKKPFTTWFKIVFALSLLFAVLIFCLPHSFNYAFLPMTLLLAFRSLVHCNFDWFPIDV
ncbi:MAG: DUF4105 domain-containing protein [Bacteroidales bacterium]|nr:DUF4105 domain-containing protein [Bacteroidales bacterium]